MKSSPLQPPLSCGPHVDSSSLSESLCPLEGMCVQLSVLLGQQTGHWLSYVLSQMGRWSSQHSHSPWSLGSTGRSQTLSKTCWKGKQTLPRMQSLFTVHPLQAAVGHPHSLPCLRLEGKNQLKKPVCISMAVLDPSSRSSQGNRAGKYFF